MEFSLLLASKIAMMLIYSVVGYVVVRIGVMKSSESKTLSNLIVYIITPCMIIHAFQVTLTKERFAGLIATFIFSAVIQFVWILITMLLRKPLRLTAIDQATLIYSNCGNLILPLISMLLGDEYTFCVAAYMAVFNVLVWTHCVILIRGDSHPDIRKLVRNPNLVAVVIGVVLMLAGVRLPEIIDSAMAGISGMIGPTSMLIIGMVIAEKNILDAFRYPRTYPIVAGRLLIFPFIAMLLLLFSGTLRRWPFLIPVFQVSVLCASAPPASFVSQLAVVYDNEPFKASSYNIAGTILCIVTMPLMQLVYQAMF